MEINDLVQRIKQLPERVKIIVAAGFVLLMVICLLIIIWKGRYSALDSLKTNHTSTPVVQESEEDVWEEPSFYVEISGFVHKPGVYELKEPILVIELLTLAGGLLPEADIAFLHQKINLAAKVTPEQKVYIPGKGENFAEPDSYAQSALININNASLNELTSLPNIGPATAQKIIDARPYESLEDLLEVSGIGPTTYDEIVTLISL